MAERPFFAQFDESGQPLSTRVYGWIDGRYATKVELSRLVGTGEPLELSDFTISTLLNDPGTVTGAAFAAKADTAEIPDLGPVTEALAGVTDALAGKADQVALTEGLATKADQAALDATVADQAALALTVADKADQSALTAVEDALAGKADKSALAGKADQADLDVLTATTIVTVRHGNTAGTARPAADVVWWIGAAEPTNAVPHDVWDDSEAQ